MAGALKGPPAPDQPSAEQRLEVATRELAITRIALAQATLRLHQLSDEVARLIAEKIAAERGQIIHAG